MAQMMTNPGGYYTQRPLINIENMTINFNVNGQPTMSLPNLMGGLPNLLQQLHGLIRFRVRALTPALRSRLQALPDGRLVEPEADGWLELHCRDVKPTVVRLITAVNEAHTELVNLEIEEPNLERVFLDLTGRELRD